MERFRGQSPDTSLFLLSHPHLCCSIFVSFPRNVSVWPFSPIPYIAQYLAHLHMQSVNMFDTPDFHVALLVYWDRARIDMRSNHLRARFSIAIERKSELVIQSSVLDLEYRPEVEELRNTTV